MPPSRSNKLLWDATHAIDLATGFIQTRDFEDYLTDVLLRSAVERQLLIVGEALAQLAQSDPETAFRVPEIRRIIGFRNVLVHGYGVVDDRTVWDLFQRRLPELREALQRLQNE